MNYSLPTPDDIVLDTPKKMNRKLWEKRALQAGLIFSMSMIALLAWLGGYYAWAFTGHDEESSLLIGLVMVLVYSSWFVACSYALKKRHKEESK